MIEKINKNMEGKLETIMNDLGTNDVMKIKTTNGDYDVTPQTKVYKYNDGIRLNDQSKTGEVFIFDNEITSLESNFNFIEDDS